MRRVAETEADWYFHEVLQPQFARSAGLEVLDPNDPTSSEELSAFIDDAILAIYHGQQGRTWMNNVVRGIGGQLADAGLHDRTEKNPAICFLDVTGYTRLTQERGDAAAAHLAEELGRLVQRTSAQHGGRTIKWLGDGVMFYFDNAAPSVVAALEMVEQLSNAGLPPAHVGIHSGPVRFQQGDYFGQTVNLCSRIAEFARPNEVLASREVVEASTDAPVEFSEIGPVELKGVSGAIDLYSARRKPG
jgi:class 3 adenylate cyclase